jgi:hypothetical protein
MRWTQIISRVVTGRALNDDGEGLDPISAGVVQLILDTVDNP